MHSSTSIAVAYFAAYASAHGVVTTITGANGVEMPGLTIADGTPRDCTSNGCGSQADTAIIRDREIRSGDVGPLGRTQGNGPVSAETMISSFMGGGTAPTNNGTGVGVEDDLSGSPVAQSTGGSRNQNKRGTVGVRQFLSNLLGGLGGGAGGGQDGDKAGGGGGGGGGLLSGLTGGGGGGGGAGGLLSGLTGGGQGTKNDATAETSVASTAGDGATEGLPTCADDGTVTMTYLQINQDGAGPLEAMVDGTSGGTEMTAFQDAEVTQDVPGLGFGGLSLATATNFPVKVQMPAGMTCDASVGGADNVCVVRVRNSAAAGPFGGAAAFTQSPAARKRAIAYRLKKRMEINRSA